MLSSSTEFPSCPRISSGFSNSAPAASSVARFLGRLGELGACQSFSRCSILLTKATRASNREVGLKVDKRRLPALLLLVAVSVAGHPVYSQGEGQRCAFIAEVSGKAVLGRGGKYYLLSGMEGAYCGEVVRVLPKAKVVVAECGDNLKFEIPGPAEFTIAPRKPVFKNGRAKNPVKIDPELCPFFLGQAFKKLRLPEVDAKGNIPPERVGTEIIYKPDAEYIFSGYISEIKGDVYLVSPEVLRVIGDMLPSEGTQLLSRDNGAYTIYSCGEGRKYRVEGSALVRFNETGKMPRVDFVRGQAAKVEDVDPDACWARQEALLNQDNFKPAGLDGK